MIIKVLPRIKMETNHFDTIDERYKYFLEMQLCVYHLIL